MDWIFSQIVCLAVTLQTVYSKAIAKIFGSYPTPHEGNVFKLNLKVPHFQPTMVGFRSGCA